MVFVTKVIRLTRSRPLLSTKHVFSMNYFHVEGFVFESRSQHSLKKGIGNIFATCSTIKECQSSSEIAWKLDVQCHSSTAHRKTLSAQWPWSLIVDLNFQSFTGNYDVSIWAKYSWEGQRRKSKQGEGEVRIPPPPPKNLNIIITIDFYH